MMNELISKARNILIQNKSGHLPLNERVKIAKALKTPALVNKLFLECCKLVYEKCNIKDQTVSDILAQAQDFLYQNKTSDFEKLYNQNKNYLESIPSGPFSKVAAATLALCASLAYSAAGILNIEDYHGQNDDQFDWEEWNPDYLASNAFAGGEPSGNKENIEKRRKFWEWYLDMVLRIYNNPDNPPTPVVQPVEVPVTTIPRRSQNLNDEFIVTRLKSVVDLIFEDIGNSIDEKEWEYIFVEGQNIGGMGMVAHFVDKRGGKQKINLQYYLQTGDRSSVKLMQQIKEHVYKQKPEEGTWFSYKISITPNKDHTINYNFYEFEIYEGKTPNKENFIAEFSKYPRAKDFVPGWWQEIIEKNKLSYL